MPKTYNSTAAKAGDSEITLLEKIVQRQGGALKWGETVKSLLAKLLGLTSPARVFRATLLQSGTAAPVVTVLENTLGDDLVFSRSDVGEYGISSPLGKFTTDKTHVLFGQTRKLAEPAVVTAALANPNIITFNTVDVATALPDDERLHKTAIQILVYP